MLCGMYGSYPVAPLLVFQEETDYSNDILPLCAISHNGTNCPGPSCRLSVTQISAAPNQRPPMIMSIATHPGVLVSMPPAPTVITTTSIPQQQPQPSQPKAILAAPQVYRIEPSASQSTPSQHTPSSETDQHTQQSKQLHQQQQHVNIKEQQPANHNSQIPTPATSTTVPKPSLANIKEKTPMCLVNELARYNKIEHVYRLTGEQGPAHKKIFTVTLKLGKEDYEAEGPSIKKAQHAAAAKALTKTELKHPPMKSMMSRPGNRQFSPGVTPTVKLNALAMKRGERAVYVIDNTVSQPPGFFPRHGLSFPQNTPRFGIDSRRNIRGHYPFDSRYYGQFRPGVPPHNQDLYSVRLLVGEREYQGTRFGLSGENNLITASSQSAKLTAGGTYGGFNTHLPKYLGHGSTVQAAKHDAASKAIDHIKQLDGGTDRNNENGQVTNHSSNNFNTDANTDLKSPISLVYEIALKRNLNVHFEVLSEKGPPHMKVFITQCKVGSFMSEGEGNGKKISKKRAAEKILEELTKLPPLPPHLNMIPQLRRKRMTNKKKTRNLIKVNVERPAETAEEVNPISRLIQIQQANKEREPIYTVLEERGAPRRREFVIEAAVNGRSCTGIGPNKKVAKRNAADALLVELGYNPSKAIEPKSSKADKSDKNRKVTFVEEKRDTQTSQNVGGSGGRQLVPGVLLVTEKASFNKTKNDNAEPSKPISTSTLKAPPPGVRSKDQLLYLADLLNIEVQFSDFPKANHEMYLTLVSLGTNPPQVCHGEGPTTDTSHEKASLEALKVLSELGLDIAAKKGNGNQVAKE